MLVTAAGGDASPITPMSSRPPPSPLYVSNHLFSLAFLFADLTLSLLFALQPSPDTPEAGRLFQHNIRTNTHKRPTITVLSQLEPSSPGRMYVVCLYQLQAGGWASFCMPFWPTWCSLCWGECVLMNLIWYFDVFAGPQVHSNRGHLVPKEQEVSLECSNVLYYQTVLLLQINVFCVHFREINLRDLLCWLKVHATSCKSGMRSLRWPLLSIVS